MTAFYSHTDANFGEGLSLAHRAGLVAKYPSLKQHLQMMGTQIGIQWDDSEHWEHSDIQEHFNYVANTEYPDEEALVAKYGYVGIQMQLIRALATQNATQ